MDCQKCKDLQAQIEKLKKQLAQKPAQDIEFVNVETNTFAEAFQYAAVQFARRYPGAVSTVETMESLIQQYLASKGINYGREQ